MKRKDFHFKVRLVCDKCTRNWLEKPNKCSCGGQVVKKIFIVEVATLEQPTPVRLMDDIELDIIMVDHFVKRLNKRNSGPKSTHRMHPMWYWNIMFGYQSWKAAKTHAHELAQ